MQETFIKSLFSLALTAITVPQHGPTSIRNAPPAFANMLRSSVRANHGRLFIGVRPKAELTKAGVKYTVHSIPLAEAMRLVHSHLGKRETIQAIRGHVCVRAVAELLSITAPYLTFDWLRPEQLKPGDTIILVESPYMSEVLEPYLIKGAELAEHGVQITLIEVQHVAAVTYA